MRRPLLGLFLGCCALLLGTTPGGKQLSFSPPIDGVSFLLKMGSSVSVRAYAGGSWTPWKEVSIEQDDMPLSRETTVELFPAKTGLIEVRGEDGALAHPIRLSDAPLRIEQASLFYPARPRILTRAEWGADESLLLKASETTEQPTEQPKERVPSDESAAVPERVKVCEEAQKLYPGEFRQEKTVSVDAQGRALQWTQGFSPSIKLLVVHHTAQLVQGDGRTPLERVRALYQYHAKSLHWGDIGYHYVVDEEGQIYEGRTGGDRVVGGHAYCANIGTIGVALLGNFESEQPTQVQVENLQWLLKELSTKYSLDPSRNTVFHGVSRPVIVGHRDLVSTACPGYYLYGAMDQIRDHVASGNVSLPVRFPPPLTKNYVDRTDERRLVRLKTYNINPEKPTLTSLNGTELTVRPGGQVTVSLLFRAGSAIIQSRSRIASVVRSSPRIGIWQELNGDNIRVRDDLLLPRLLHEGEVETLRLRIQVPTEPDTYTVDIGTLTLVLTTEGRRTRSPVGEPTRQTFTELDRINIPTPGSRRLSSSSSSAISVPSFSQANPLIRIRLTSREKEETSCASVDFGSLSGLYRGDITCAVIAGKAAVINELSLEEYLFGLGEEPDTELYEKQRAFAVAARSYAAYYLDREHRKFPGMPYDGDDSPQRFQLYSGLGAERANPQWVRAVRSTEGLVLTVDGEVLKTPYFSSDDGRTRTPEENGWKDFPHPEVFSKKADPWCTGLPLAGHGVGMSGCGAKGQAKEGKKAEDILRYYYPGTILRTLTK